MLKEFKGHLMKLRIEQQLTTAGRHQSNGQAEAKIQHVQTMLRKECADQADMLKWTSFLPVVLHSINHARSSGKADSPADILLPGAVRDHAALKRRMEEREQSGIPSELTKEIGTDLSEIQVDRIDNTHKRRRRNQEHRDGKLSSRSDTLEPGQLVLRRYEVQPPHKLAARLSGPFRVVSTRPGDIVKLWDMVLEKEIEDHVTNLVKFDSDRLPDPQRMAYNDRRVYLVSKVMKHRGKQIFVRWCWYGPEYDEWIPLKNICVSKNIALLTYLRENGLQVKEGSVTRSRDSKRARTGAKVNLKKTKCQ